MSATTPHHAWHMHLQSHPVHVYLFSHRAGESPLVIDGAYAMFSSVLPSEWTLPTAEIGVTDAVLSETEAGLKIESAVDGKIALIPRQAGITNWAKVVKHASAAGAVGVIFVNDTKEFIGMPTGDTEEYGYMSKIPVLMVKSSDVTKLREQGSGLIRDKGTRYEIRDTKYEFAGRE